MLVLGINKICNWCQITTISGKYTCPIKEIDGELFFRFKKVWHPISKYISEHAEELVQEGGTTFSRPFTK